MKNKTNGHWTPSCIGKYVALVRHYYGIRTPSVRHGIIASLAGTIPFSRRMEGWWRFFLIHLKQIKKIHTQSYIEKQQQQQQRRRPLLLENIHHVQLAMFQFFMLASLVKSNFIPPPFTSKPKGSGQMIMNHQHFKPLNCLKKNMLALLKSSFFPNIVHYISIHRNQ